MKCPFFINPRAYNRTVPFDIEQWYPLNYPGIVKNRYLISTYGRVYSKYSKKILTPFTINSGYQSVHLSVDGELGKTRNVTVHRLMAYTFANPPENFKELEVNHINGNKMANTYTNVEWVTESENMQHAIKNNLAKTGDQLHQSLISNETAIEIAKRLQAGMHYKDILREVGLPITNQYLAMVDNIKNRRSYRYVCESFNFDDHSGKTYPISTVHQICDLIAKDTSISKICEIILGRKYQGSIKDKQFYEYIRLIKTKKTFRNISDQYF